MRIDGFLKSTSMALLICSLPMAALSNSCSPELLDSVAQASINRLDGSATRQIVAAYHFGTGRDALAEEVLAAYSPRSEFSVSPRTVRINALLQAKRFAEVRALIAEQPEKEVSDRVLAALAAGEDDELAMRRVMRQVLRRVVQETAAGERPSFRSLEVAFDLAVRLGDIGAASYAFELIETANRSLPPETQPNLPFEIRLEAARMRNLDRESIKNRVFGLDPRNLNSLLVEIIRQSPTISVDDALDLSRLAEPPSAWISVMLTGVQEHLARYSREEMEPVLGNVLSGIDALSDGILSRRLLIYETLAQFNELDPVRAVLDADLQAFLDRADEPEARFVAPRFVRIYATDGRCDKVIDLLEAPKFVNSAFRVDAINALLVYGHGGSDPINR